MNHRNQYDYRGSRPGRRPDDEQARQHARGERYGRPYDDDPRQVSSRVDHDDTGEYEAGPMQDDEQYLGGYASERGQQYYNAPRQPVQYGQPHDPPGRDAEPYDHPAQGRQQAFGPSGHRQPPRYPQYGQPRGGRDYGGAYGPEDFRQGSGMRHWEGQASNQFGRQQRSFAGQGYRSASSNDMARGYGNFRQQQFQPGGVARDFDEGDYDQAFGGYSPSQRGYGDSWSGYGRGGYGPTYGQAYEQNLMGTTNSTVGTGGFGQGPAAYERHGYGQGMYGGGYSQGLAGRGGYTGSSFAEGSEGDYYGARRESNFGKGPKGYVRSDERLKEDLSEKLMRDHAIDASDINVEVKNGIVTLTGTVEERRLKHYAEDLAEACTGVKDVDNRLTVRKRASETSSLTASRGAGGTTASSATPAGSGSLGGSTSGDDGATPRKN